MSDFDYMQLLKTVPEKTCGAPQDLCFSKGPPRAYASRLALRTLRRSPSPLTVVPLSSREQALLM